MAGENCDIGIPPGFATPFNLPSLRTAVGRNGNLSSNSTHLPVSRETNSQPVKRGRGRPPKQRPPIPLQAPSMVIKENPTIQLPRVPPTGSSIDAALLIPWDADEEQTETKINLNPLSMLSPPPNPRLRNECAPNINEESKTIMSQIKSVLLFQLTSGSTKNIEAMVKCANNAFFNLELLEVDYTSFYNDVNGFISNYYDLLMAKRQREMQFFPELKKRYEDAISYANDLKDQIVRTQGHVEMVMKKKEPLERRIVKAMELIGKLKQFVAFFEEGEEALKHKKQKYIEAHEVAQHEVQKLRTQVEAAEDVLREIDQRKDAALNCIESTIRRLKSIQS